MWCFWTTTTCLLLPWTLAVYDRLIREFNSPPLILGSLSYFPKPLPTDAGSGEISSGAQVSDYLCKDVAVGLSCSRMVIRKSVYDSSAELRNAFKAC